MPRRRGKATSAAATDAAAPISPFSKAKGKQPMHLDQQSHSAASAESDQASMTSASEDDDSSSASSATTSSSEEDDDDVEVDSPALEDLERLAAAASTSIRERKAQQQKAQRAAFETGEDVISFGTSAGAGGGDPGPSTSAMRKARKMQSEQAPQTKPSKRKDVRLAESSAERLGTGELLEQDAEVTSGRHAQKARRNERSKTAGSGWFDMPRFPTTASGSVVGASGSTVAARDPTQLTRLGASAVAGDARAKTALEMRREIMAVRLRNMMDPKRFYRGSKTGKIQMPEFAQLGTIISSPFEPKQQLRRDERGHSVVEELIKDAEAAAYAKKKYSELQVRSRPGGKTHYKIKKDGKGKKGKAGSRR